jgi:hypothetical protein
MLNLSAIYTGGESGASGAAFEFTRCGRAGSWAARCFRFGNRFHLCFHFGRALSHGVTMVSEDVSNVSIFSEEF